MASRYSRPSISSGSYSLREEPCVSVPACSMWKTLRQLRGNLAASPNRIAFAWALRGTIATGLPLVALPALGSGPLSNFVVIGALNTSMVDVGGSYRSRLAAMALNAVISPMALLLGSFARENGWIAAALMFLVAFASGLIRALGPAGVSLGLTVGLTFLVGIGVHHHGGSALEWAGLYIAGGLWTILLTLAFWHVRPYRRLEQEVAAAWEETATLVATARAFVGPRPSVVRRRRQERLIAKRHQALREAVEKALSSLGYVRGKVSGPGVTMAQFLILLRAASRIGAAAVTLSELPVQAEDGPERAVDVRAQRLVAAEELETACRSVAVALLAGWGEVSLGPMQARITELIALLGEEAGEVLAYAQAIRHLESAAEALDTLYGGGRAHPRVHIGVRRPWPLADTLETLRAHFSFRSAIFRHALRVGLATAAGTAVAHLQLAHGIWVPMATLIVLQPEFGGTINRALQRTAGTVAGATLAGLMLATLNGTLVFEPLYDLRLIRPGYLAWATSGSLSRVSVDRHLGCDSAGRRLAQDRQGSRNSDDPPHAPWFVSPAHDTSAYPRPQPSGSPCDPFSRRSYHTPRHRIGTPAGYRVTFAKEVMGVRFLIASVEVRRAHNADR